VVESNTSQAHFFYVSTCRDVKKWLVSTTQSYLLLVAIPSCFYLPFQDLPQELRIDFIASCDKDCLWCVKTIRTVLWIIYKPQYPCACVMCQKSPSWQRQNHMSSGWKKGYPTGSHCAFHYHNQTWKIWRDACYYFLHLTAFSALEKSRQKRNEITLAAHHARMENYGDFLLYNIFNAQIEGGWG